MTQDNFIHVSEEAWGDQRPRAVSIHVILTADKLFSGRAAFEKATELRKLAMALAERDFPDSAIALTGASLDVSTGIFTKSSSVTYRIRIRVDDSERLPDALEAIAECKQARLTHLDWDYSNSVTEELLVECATRAIAKAKRLATALGVALGDVQGVHEEQIGETQVPPTLMPHAYPMAMHFAARPRMGADFEGLDLAPTKKVGVRVRVAYAMAAPR
jgi:hypothetical protein